MKRSFASLSILAASLSLLHAYPAVAQESSMKELQATLGARANAVAMTTGMARSIGDSSKAVAGNLGSSGKAPGSVAAEGRSASRDAALAANVGNANARALNPQPLPPGRMLPEQRTPPRQDLASLNPQPLPPVETGRRPAAAGQGKDKALTTGIIIVGGKTGIAR